MRPLVGAVELVFDLGHAHVVVPLPGVVPLLAVAPLIASLGTFAVAAAGFPSSRGPISPHAAVCGGPSPGKLDY